MEKTAATIESLMARAEEFRARATDCAIPRYSELMRKGAAHLDEQARTLEGRIAARLSAGLLQLCGINEADQ